MAPHEHMTIDGRKVLLPLRGMAAVEAAGRGADLYADTADGMKLIAADRREWVISRAKRMPKKVFLGQFAAPAETNK